MLRFKNERERERAQEILSTTGHLYLVQKDNGVCEIVEPKEKALNTETCDLCPYVDECPDANTCGCPVGGE